MVGEFLNGLGTAVNTISQLRNNRIQQEMNNFNMDMANKQFEAQLALNERNSITGQVAEMARNGLNPLAGNNMANGQGSVSGSQVANSVTGIDFSSMSQLGSQLMENAQKDKDRQNAKNISSAGLKNAMTIAEMEDENRKSQLAMEKEKNDAEVKHWKALNDYEEKNGVPYEHRSGVADTITALASIISNTFNGKSSISDIPNAFDNATGTNFTGGSLTGDANHPGNKNWTDEEIAEMYNSIQGSRQERYNEIKKRTGLDITKIRKMTGTY